MKISTKTTGDVVVLSLAGKIMGGPDYDEFRNEVKSHIEAGRLKILLDFSRISFINSTGLGLLVSAYTSLRTANGAMKICNVNDRVGSIFYVTQLNDVFDILPDVDAGMAAFA